MRISDWSSDVCSSDLAHGALVRPDRGRLARQGRPQAPDRFFGAEYAHRPAAAGVARRPHLLPQPAPLFLGADAAEGVRAAARYGGAAKLPRPRRGRNRAPADRPVRREPAPARPLRARRPAGPPARFALDRRRTLLFAPRWRNRRIGKNRTGPQSA